MLKFTDNKNDTQFLRFIGVPFLLVVAPFCGYYIGKYLDRYLGTDPYLTYLFLFLGVVAAVREFYKLIIEFRDNDNTDH